MIEEMNELLIIVSFVLIYSCVMLFYKLYGKAGLIAMNVLVTILANIEVLLLVKAFGIEMTLGNVLFASTFLITDVLSENHGKKEANKAVIIGSACSVLFVVISQLWLLYTPSENDWAKGAFDTIFAVTPRIVCVSLLVYLVSQLTDVWLYHKWWDWCKKRFGNAHSGLWIRNNGSTLISQLFNTFLYTFLAFYGIYPTDVLWTIFCSSYAIYVVTSLLDTPVVYWCRQIHESNKVN